MLDIEKIISDKPPNKNESAKRMDKVNNEPAGDINTMTLTITKNNPTNTGMYQCLIASLIDLKNGY